MQYYGRRWLLGGALLVLSLAAANRLQAGGSGLNTVVIINQNSANSRELGNYYCERRGVPPENVLRINWPGGNILWNSSQLQTNLLSPLLGMLTTRQLTNQVEYLVLSMDIPFQTLNGTQTNSTTSALFYGLKDENGTNWTDLVNSYYATEQTFRQGQPASAPGYSFLTTMLTAHSLAQAKTLVDQGVASDGTQPAQPVILAKSSDAARNIRYRLFDSAIFNSQIIQRPVLMRVNSDSPAGQTGLLGYETGLSAFNISANAFVPGAMADNLTSFGGIIFGPVSQTTLLGFIEAGAAGSYGTVTEPSPNTQKFPNAQNYFYQGRGFSLAECYYQSLYVPFQGLIVGEPLAAPFARSASGSWSGASFNGILKGAPQLTVAFSSLAPNRPLQQVDLFVDGKYSQTLTNYEPQAGNVLRATLNGYPVAYTVPAGALLSTVASGLAAALNAPATTNLTRVAAQAYGDRIELRLLASNNLATPFCVTDTSTTNPASRYFSAQYLSAPSAPAVSVGNRSSAGGCTLHLQAPIETPCYVQASTNLSAWVNIFTNLTGGGDFIDAQATNNTRRFYRTVALAQALPQLTVQNNPNVNGLVARVTGAARPCVILESTDQVHWTPVCTNLTVGQVQTVVSSSAGSADSLTTFLTASQDALLESPAYGLRTLNVTGTIAVGASLQLSVVKVNGAAIRVGVTNTSGSATLWDCAQQLVAAINACSALQSSDGLVAEDLTAGLFGTASFNLRARSPGRDAARIQAQLLASGGLGASPAVVKRLDANVADLQPRNHLYVSAGTCNLAVTFPLDTKSLADGFHELTAVAYEGTHVRTQTRITLPVQVQNSALAASLTCTDLADPASVQGTYHFQVTANTNNVSEISLFSTGGLLNTITNQATASFTVNGASLGAGLHPFYALVSTASGDRYRTATRWVRLVNP